MWFWRAADEIVEKYDVPNDHDGPRHFGEGMAQMMAAILSHIKTKHSKRAAQAAAIRLRSIAEQWLAENK